METGLTKEEAESWKYQFSQAKWRFLHYSRLSQIAEISGKVKNIEIDFLASINLGLENRRKEEKETGKEKIILIQRVTELLHKMIDFFIKR